MCDLVTILYTVSYNPCKHPHALHKCLHNKQAQIFLVMETKACDCSNKPYVGRGIFSMLKTKTWNETWGFYRISESHTYH
jgi:hypothetical protein